jgi:hypothetical protein
MTAPLAFPSTASSEAVPLGALPSRGIRAQGFTWLQGAGTVLGAAVVYSGWLAMLQMGQTLSWSWFSGLLAVALWWFCVPSQSSPSHTGRPRAVLLWLGVALLGLWLAQTLGRSGWGWGGLALCAVGWGRLCRPAPAWLGGHGAPVSLAHWGVSQLAGLGLAVWLAGDPATWAERWWGAGVLLVLCAVVQIRQVHGLSVPRACQSHVRPDATMAVMMGSLLLMSQWCLAAGWTLPQALLAHGAAMVAGQVVVGWLNPHLSLPVGLRLSIGAWLSLSAAGMVWLGGGGPWMLGAMALLSAGSAWMAHGLRGDPNPWFERIVGVSALLWVGGMAPTHGPGTVGLALLAVASLMAASRWIPLVQRRQA